MHRVLRRGAVVAAFCFCLAIPASALADGGGSDASFGTGGVFSLPDSQELVSAGTDANGNLYAAQVQSADANHPSRMVLTKTSPKGVRDTTYDAFINGNPAFSVVWYPDGRALLARTVCPPGAACSLTLQRITHDGAIDTTFGDGGTVSLSDFPDTAVPVVLGPGGSIYYANLEGEVGRLTAAGLRDATFGPGGVRLASTGVEGLFPAPDGSLFVSGSVNAPNLPFETYDCCHAASVLKLRPDGTADPTFGSGGIAQVDAESSIATSLAISPGGNLYVAGMQRGQDPARNYLGFVARFSAAGVLDTTFGGPLDFVTGIDELPLRIALDAQNRPVIAGYVIAPREGTPHKTGVVARLTVAGHADQAFGHSGSVGVPDTEGFQLLQVDSLGGIVVGNSTEFLRFSPIAAPGPPDTKATVADFITVDHDHAVDFTRYIYSDEAPSAGFECKLDSGAWNTCPAGGVVIGRGTHSVGIRTADALGRVDPTPLTKQFTVDPGPITTFTSGPNGRTNDSTPTFTFSSDQPNTTFECSLYDMNGRYTSPGPFLPCSGPGASDRTGPLADGLYSLSVRGTSGAHTETQAAYGGFVIDTVAPTTRLDTPIPAATLEHTFNLAVTGDSQPGSGVRCRVDGGIWASCGTPNDTGRIDFTLGPLADGRHIVEAQAFDGAGNFDPDPIQAEFRIYPHKPVVVSTSGPADGSTVTTSVITFSFTTEDFDAHLECSMDGSEFSECTSPTTVRFSAGSHTFAVRGYLGDHEVVGDPISVSFHVTQKSGPSNSNLRLDVLKRSAPDSIRGLIRRGVTTRLRCSIDCRATVDLLIRNSAARDLGLGSPVAGHKVVSIVGGRDRKPS